MDSKPLEASSLPSGLKNGRPPGAPFNVRSSCPVLVSQILVVPSCRVGLVVANRLPSGLKATHETCPWCPFRDTTSRPVFASHSFAVLSQLPVAIHFPSRLKAVPIV